MERERAAAGGNLDLLLDLTYFGAEQKTGTFPAKRLGVEDALDAR